MALDSQYVLEPEIQALFRDKDSALPLIGGIVRFWEDENRLIPKEVYTLQGSPPNYTYVSLGSSLVLNNAGAFDDQIYFKPFDTDGNIQLYYITVESSDSIFQFDREAWPNTFATSSDVSVDENFIPNGQFKLHNDLPVSGSYVAGEIRDPITYVAPGGFVYRGNNVTQTTEITVTYDLFPAYTLDPDKSPRYAINITKSGVTNEGFAELQIRFGDVNKFASDTEEFTFQFSASSSLTSTIQSINIYKFFGTGGTPSGETYTAIATGSLAVGATYGDIIASGFVFGDNASKDIGTNGDDFVAIAIRFPLTTSFQFSMTDFVLTEGNLASANFDNEPDRYFIRDALGGGFPIPAYDGSDLYLPPLLTREGWIYDTSIIGSYKFKSYDSLEFNELACDGSKYETQDYSSLGIPYRRLWEKWFNLTLNIPIYGTGKDYFSGIYPNDAVDTSTLRLTNNEFGGVSLVVAGATDPGFSYREIHIGSSTGYYINSIWGGTNIVYLQNLFVGATITPSGNTTGFTITHYVQEGYERLGETFSRAYIEIKTNAASTLTGGEKFEWESYNGAILVKWYTWFTINGAGADPAPVGYTAIKIDLNGNETANEVAQIVAEAHRGGEMTEITTVAAGSIPANAYFEAQATGNDFYVWYNIDGSGTDPLVSGKTAIEVSIASADTAATVAEATQIAINSKYFAVPDTRGQFLRGWDNGAGIDPQAALRYSFVPGVQGDLIGTYQFDQISNHNHNWKYSNVGQNGGGDGVRGTNSVDTTAIEFTGGTETRPINFSVGWVVKY